ncbi:unnamed protein product [Urochloa humidicola]
MMMSALIQAWYDPGWRLATHGHLPVVEAGREFLESTGVEVERRDAVDDGGGTPVHLPGADTVDGVALEIGESRRGHGEAVEGIDEDRLVADTAGEVLPGRIGAAVVETEGLGEVSVGVEEAHPLGLGEEEEVVSGDGEVPLGGEVDVGGREDGGDVEGERVDDGGVADVLVEDEELGGGVVDAGDVAAGEGGDGGPGGGEGRDGVRVGVGGEAEEDALAAGDHDAVRGPVPGEVVGLLERGGSGAGGWRR